MKKINLIFGVLFLIVLSISTYGQNAVYDYYFGVGESELFKYYPTNLTAYSKLFVETDLVNLSKIDDYFYTYITCTEEKDIPVSVVEITAENTTNTSYSDNTIESQINLEANKIYVVNSTKPANHYIASQGFYFVCAYLKKTGSVNFDIRFYVGDSNGTSVEWVSSSPITINTVNFTQYCSNLIDHDHDYINQTSEEYFGVSCTNCNPSQTVALGVDLNTSGSSRIFNSSSIYYNYTYSNNFAISVLEDGNNFEFYELDDFRCRIPYYLDIYLKKTNETFSSLLTEDSFCNEVDYIMLEPYSNSLSTRTINSMNSVFKFIPGSNQIPSIGTNYDDIVYWNKYNSCHALVKMYELGNYTIYVGSPKISVNFKEFEDPRNQDDYFITDITKSSPYEITEKNDTTVIISATLWELSSSRVVSNYLAIGTIIALIIVIPTIVFFGIKKILK